VYAQAESAPKTIWLPVTATAPLAPVPNAPGDDGPAGSPAPYASRAALIADLDWLREIGAKGFFVDSLRLTDPAPASAAEQRGSGVTSRRCPVRPRPQPRAVAGSACSTRPTL
jgi:hypothetical protein